MSISELRREYADQGLSERDLDPDPIVQFQGWFAQALAAELPDANAMTLATCDAAGRPSARVVLLKEVDELGFVFFTNYGSRKGKELAANPRAALIFFWSALDRQVCVGGRVSEISREESEAYFATRPRASQLAAWVAVQSSVVASRAALEDKMRDLENEYAGGSVTTPPQWGGYVLAPDEIEFWQGRPSRLHDRLRYVRQDNGAWRIERLAP